MGGEITNQSGKGDKRIKYIETMLPFGNFSQKYFLSELRFSHLTVIYIKF